MIMVHRQHSGKQKRPMCGALSAFSLQSETFPHLPEKIMDQSLFLKQQQSEVAAERRKMPIHISRNILIPPQVYICPYTILSYMITQTKTGHIVSRFMLFLYIVSSRFYRQLSANPHLCIVSTFADLIPPASRGSSHRCRCTLWHPRS